jgi:hypothetical protein
VKPPRTMNSEIIKSNSATPSRRNLLQGTTGVKLSLTINSKMIKG